MELIQKYRTFKESIKFKYVPPIVNWFVARATWRAKQNIRRFGEVAILVDGTVMQHAVTHETAWVSTGTKKWGPHEFESGYSARVPVHPVDAKNETYINVCFLAGISELFTSGYIKLYTSKELLAERLRQPHGRYSGYGFFDYSLFDVIYIPSVDGLGFSMCDLGAKSITALKEDQLSRIEEYKKDFSFLELVRCLGDKNSLDAWHIYTAEKFNMYCYLTMDFSLIRTLKSQSGHPRVKSLQTLVLTPEEFSKRFQIPSIPPNVFSYHHARSFVRPDLSMPGGKRRRRSDYKKPNS